MMKNVRVSNNVTRKTVIVDTANTTVRNVFAQAEIDCTGMISINGVTLMASELDENIDCFIAPGTMNIFASSVQKLDNAYTVNVLSDVAIITSAISAEDFAYIKRVNGDLILEDEDGNQTFRVTTGEESSVSNYGIVFAVNGEKLTAKIELPAGLEDRAAYIAETYYNALTRLKNAEVQVEEELPEMRNDFAELADSIKVLD